MIREKAIKQAALEYLDNFISDICGICDEDIYDAYISGAQWADAHPNFGSIWQQASEYPKYEFDYIVYYSSHISKFDVDKPVNMLKRYGGTEYLWSFVVKNLGITKWTYLETILAKGGAEIV